MPAFLIEFIGPSGSGKSFLAVEAKEILEEKGINVQLVNAYGRYTPKGRPKRRSFVGLDWLWITTAYAALVQPSLALWCLLNLRRRGRHSVLAHVRQLAALCRSVLIVNHLRDGVGTYLIDEGPSKVITTLVARGVSFQDWLQRIAPVPDLCILVLADEKVILDRLKNRGDLGVSEENLIQIIRDHGYAINTARRSPRMEVVCANDLGDSINFLKKKLPVHVPSNVK